MVFVYGFNGIAGDKFSFFLIKSIKINSDLIKIWEK